VLRVAVLFVEVCGDRGELIGRYDVSARDILLRVEARRELPVDCEGKKKGQGRWRDWLVGRYNKRRLTR
jgi:hypothetical protein